MTNRHTKPQALGALTGAHAGHIRPAMMIDPQGDSWQIGSTSCRSDKVTDYFDGAG